MKQDEFIVLQTTAANTMIFLLLGMVNDNSVEDVEFIPPPLKLFIGREGRIPKENASTFKTFALREH